jgi:hypothetical protein
MANSSNEGRAPNSDDLERLAGGIKPSWELDDAPFSMGNRVLTAAEWAVLHGKSGPNSDLQHALIDDSQGILPSDLVSEPIGFGTQSGIGAGVAPYVSPPKAAPVAPPVPAAAAASPVGPTGTVTMSAPVAPAAAAPAPVIATPPRTDREPAVEVARAIRAASPTTLVAFGGRVADAAAASLGDDPARLVLPGGMVAAVDALRRALANRRSTRSS